MSLSTKCDSLCLHKLLEQKTSFPPVRVIEFHRMHRSIEFFCFALEFVNFATYLATCWRRVEASETAQLQELYINVYFSCCKTIKSGFRLIRGALDCHSSLVFSSAACPVTLEDFERRFALISSFRMKAFGDSLLDLRLVHSSFFGELFNDDIFKELTVLVQEA